MVREEIGQHYIAQDLVIPRDINIAGILRDQRLWRKYGLY